MGTCGVRSEWFGRKGRKPVHFGAWREKEKGRRDKRGKQDALEIPGADSLAEPARVDVRHQLYEPVLRLLHPHRFALNVSDLFHGGFLLVVRERVDMVEDVRPFSDVEGGSRVGLVGWLGMG